VAASAAELQPPVFLKLAGHPIRWRLLSELAGSDRRVQELVAELDQPQSLISYHLGRLRTGGFVSERRSEADGRDAYYSLDLARYGELLAQSGEALHPGLHLMARGGIEASEPAAAQSVPWARVLFLCTENSARSQIAEALLRRLSRGSIEAYSAGSRPTQVHPHVARVLGKQEIDSLGLRSKHMNEFAGERFDYVISLCDRLREVCPAFPGDPERVHWSFPDPTGEGGSEEAIYLAFERTSVQLAIRIRFLILLIERDRIRRGEAGDE
jgi:ArsR family transcriptional regulator, arsenate/arsenite/antimonite-responsive transcriptional repressor / arsenate reductase (thioredoxin)